MTGATNLSGNPSGRQAGSSALYRAVWRWHFIAGLLILPFIFIITITGGIYLFKDEINNTVYRDLRIVAQTDTAPLAASQIIANALTAYPGELKAYQPAPMPNRTAEVKILGEDGLKNSIFVNPYTGDVLGSLWDAGASGTPAMYVVRKLHSLEYVGWVGNRIIEAVAGWMVLLTVTGIYLWWPRGKKVGTATIKATKGRPWWRDMHAVTGIYSAAFIVFLAMTGLPWSSVWGGYFYDSAYALGLGMPDGYWTNKPQSTVMTGEALDRTPWIMEQQPMPVSGAASGVPAGLDQVVATVEGLGIAPGYALNMPSGETGVFSASVYPDDITQERVIHLDQYTIEVLYDAGLNDLGALGWAAEWGISIHMGQAWGLVNQIVLLLVCVAMMVMSVAAGAMWWKRRPAGAIGTPQFPTDWRIPRTVLFLAIVAGVFFPLVGLTLIVLAIIECLIYLIGARKLQAS